MSPQRVQMTRKWPWRTDHPDAVIVARPSKWGNPFSLYRRQGCGYWDVRDENGVTYLIDHAAARNLPTRWDNKREAAEKAVDLFAGLYGFGSLVPERDPWSITEELRGRDLACWCPLDMPCHADWLMQIANGEVSA